MCLCEYQIYKFHWIQCCYCNCNGNWKLHHISNSMLVNLAIQLLITIHLCARNSRARFQRPIYESLLHQCYSNHYTCTFNLFNVIWHWRFVEKKIGAFLSVTKDCSDCNKSTFTDFDTYIATKDSLQAKISYSDGTLITISM